MKFNFKDRFFEIIFFIVIFLIEVSLPVVFYTKIYDIDLNSNLLLIIFKYILLMFLYKFSFLFHRSSKRVETEYDIYYVIIFCFGFVFIISELYMNTLNMNTIYVMSSSCVFLYVIFNLITYFSIFLKFNNCKFIKKDVSIRTFISYFCYIYVLIVVDNLIYKIFIITIRELFTFKVTFYIVEMILSFIYLCKRNEMVTTLLLLIYQFVFLFAMELNTLYFFYENFNYLQFPVH
ncbi:hypothetical protein CWI38_0209p0050 [Hamiltosporidium tvaerminnensis]|uniref:Uncharacterized protein n=1 Tax=Hamiltosporidium tvaerminnensis TaxID=1176355 RepID=A0A4Q9M2G9_9MICR|nr:hypothetical protein CWI38_0209p0050 [Hamiltosporidium tvaerminnensis]